MSRSDDIDVVAANAKRLVEDPLIQRVFDELREELIRDIEDVEPTGNGLPDKATRAHAQLFALNEVRRRLVRYSAASASREEI